MGRAFDTHKQYHDPCKIGPLIEELNGKFVNHLEYLRENVEETFPSLSVDPNSAAATRKGINFFQNLESARNVFANGFGSKNRANIHRLREKCNEIYNDTEKHMVCYCKMIISQVSKQATTKTWDASSTGDDSIENDEVKVDKRSKMQNVYRYVKYANTIRNLNSTICWKTSEMYYRLIQHLIGELERTHQIANNIIETIENDPDNAKYGQLVNCIVIIMDCDWVFEFEAANLNDSDNDDYENSDDDGQFCGQISDTSKGKKENKLLVKVEKKLMQYMDRLYREMDTVAIKLGDKECLVLVAKVMNQLKNMSKLAEILPVVAKKSEQIVTMLENDVAHVLFFIQKEFDLSKINISSSAEIRLLKLLNYHTVGLMDVCKKYNINPDLSLNGIFRQLENRSRENKKDEERLVQQLSTHNEQIEKLRLRLALVASRKKVDDKNSDGFIHALKTHFLSPNSDEGKAKPSEKEQLLRKLNGDKVDCEKKLRMLDNDKKEVTQGINVVNELIDIEKQLKDINFEWTKEKLNQCRKNNRFNLEIEKIRKEIRNGNQKQFITNFNKRKANQSIIFVYSCGRDKIKWHRRSTICRINKRNKRNNDEQKLAEDIDGKQIDLDKLTMEQLVNETDNMLQDYLTQYGKAIIKQIKSNFYILKDVDRNSNVRVDDESKKNDDGHDLLQMGNDLSSMLRDLCQIESRYPMLMVHLDEDKEGNILDELVDEMSNGLNEFKRVLFQYKHSNSVKVHIGIRRANILSTIDWFLKQKTDVNTGFADIYFEYQKEFHDNVEYTHDI